MQALAPFEFEIIGLHWVGWMEITVDCDRYETKIVDIRINQINQKVLPSSVYLDMDDLPKHDQQRIQEFADQFVDDNWAEICVDNADDYQVIHHDDY